MDPEAQSPMQPTGNGGEAKPAPRTAVKVMSAIATLLIVATYIEDGTRLILQWDSQLSFVSRHMGFPRAIATVLLLVSAFMQLSSLFLLVPSDTSPQVATFKLYACILVGLNVFLQPIMYNQLSNMDLITLSAAQVGTLGLIFTNTHAELHPAAYKQQAGAFDAFVASAKSGGNTSPSWAAYMQLCSRLLLTVDLVVVYSLHMFEATPLSITTNILILIAGLLIWLGCATPYVASIVALAAFSDAFGRFPFWAHSDFGEFDRNLFHFFRR